MNRLRGFRAVLLGGLALAMVGSGLAGQLALGQDSAVSDQAVGDQQEGGGSQTLRAARLTFVHGEVTVDSVDNSGSQAAQMNLPLFAGTRVSTGDEGQAEVEFEDGSIVRLTPSSTLTIDTLRVDPSGNFVTAATLLRGLAYAEMRATSQYRYTLSAGGDAMTPVENATVRVRFDQPPATFAVLDGVVQISNQGGTHREVRVGESLEADEGGQLNLQSSVGDESWDAWNSDRDREASAEAASDSGVRNGYAGQQGYGWSDLDANGIWYDVPGSGQVWQPYVAAEEAGFDPYGVGAWVWSGPGYVWASGYSWGWVPYRCGNWGFYSGFGWGWNPVGCGGAGWRFGGAGFPVNVAVGPGGYKVPHVPHPHPGPVHPILPTRIERPIDPVALAGQTGWGAALLRGPREINGVIATPVRTGSASMLRSGQGRSALDRDFPVDQVNHQPVVGHVSTMPPVVSNGAGFTGQHGVPVYRIPDRGGVQQPGATPANSMQRPTYMPAPRTETAPVTPRPTYTPPQRPAYTPAPTYTPAPRPTYTPPPAPVQRPTYSPPPSYSPPPMQQHSAPPPPPSSAGSGGRSPK